MPFATELVDPVPTIWSVILNSKHVKSELKNGMEKLVELASVPDSGKKSKDDYKKKWPDVKRL